MITAARLAGIFLLLLCEAFIPDANMIVIIAVIAIAGGLFIDQRRERIERTIARAARQAGKRIGAESVIKALTQDPPGQSAE